MSFNVGWVTTFANLWINLRCRYLQEGLFGLSCLDLTLYVLHPYYSLSWSLMSSKDKCCIYVNIYFKVGNMMIHVSFMISLSLFVWLYNIREFIVVSLPLYSILQFFGTWSGTYAHYEWLVWCTARVKTDRDRGRSRGFGFVNFTSDDSASSALPAMDGQVIW